MRDFFELYDALIEGIPPEPVVSRVHMGRFWTAVETADGFGMAMTTEGDTVPPLLTAPMEGMPLRTLAAAVKSWNLREAGFGMAAINAWYNTPRRLDELNAYEPFARYCTDGLDLRGKEIGVVGHLNMPSHIYEQANVRILERSPRAGDYPDTACDWLLPQCDIVILTASTLTNKTLPHLLELCRDSHTILAGPSCPLCPALTAFGLDRIAGLVITDRPGMRHKLQNNLDGPPYPMGKPFLMKKTTL